jgi:antibiotic biosynthesis monooxygenase (ABM) superfamily enzyme
MPLGLDLKSLIIGIVLAWFVIPWVQAKFISARAPKTTQTGM